jgi:hypothetical protein
MTLPTDQFNSLSSAHYAEIVDGSGVSAKIAALNFRTITDPREADQLLNRNGERRWKHSDNLVPGQENRGGRGRSSNPMFQSLTRMVKPKNTSVPLAMEPNPYFWIRATLTSGPTFWRPPPNQSLLLRGQRKPGASLPWVMRRSAYRECGTVRLRGD